jgi:hypothetical protein
MARTFTPIESVDFPMTARPGYTYRASFGYQQRHGGEGVVAAVIVRVVDDRTGHVLGRMSPTYANATDLERMHKEVDSLVEKYKQQLDKNEAAVKDNSSAVERAKAIVGFKDKLKSMEFHGDLWIGVGEVSVTFGEKLGLDDKRHFTDEQLLGVFADHFANQFPAAFGKKRQEIIDLLDEWEKYDPFDDKELLLGVANRIVPILSKMVE